MHCRSCLGVQIEKSLRAKSPANGNIPGIGRRRSDISRPGCAFFSESGDTAHIRKALHFTDFSRFRCDYLGLSDCLAGVGGNRVLALLEAKGGTTIAAIARTTGWQPHSVRGFLAGVVKKKLGLKLSSEKTSSGRVHRIVGAGLPSANCSEEQPHAEAQ
jgi:hypothetical protein